MDSTISFYTQEVVIFAGVYAASYQNFLCIYLFIFIEHSPLPTEHNLLLLTCGLQPTVAFQRKFIKCSYYKVLT